MSLFMNFPRVGREGKETGHIKGGPEEAVEDVLSPW